MPTAVLPLAEESELRRVRFTRSDVEKMVEAGLFEDQRFELIDGELIDKMGQKPPHAAAIGRFQDWLIRVFGSRRVRIQLSLDVATADRERNEPEPDLAVPQEFEPEYEWRHPRGDETVLVVEVADASLRQDLTRKRDLYARAGVPEYWVVSIGDRELIVHRDLHQQGYQRVMTLRAGDNVSPVCRPEESIEVAMLFRVAR